MTDQELDELYIKRWEAHKLLIAAAEVCPKPFKDTKTGEIVISWVDKIYLTDGVDRLYSIDQQIYDELKSRHITE